MNKKVATTRNTHAATPRTATPILGTARGTRNKGKKGRFIQRQNWRAQILLQFARSDEFGQPFLLSVCRLPPPRVDQLVHLVNYFGISHTSRGVLELDDWIRRRVRLYYWKQWKRPRARRRNLIKLGVSPSVVFKASRSRKGCWRMSTNSIVQRALNNRWLKEQGVPELRSIWIKLQHGDQAQVKST